MKLFTLSIAGAVLLGAVATFATAKAMRHDAAASQVPQEAAAAEEADVTIEDVLATMMTPDGEYLWRDMTPFVAASDSAAAPAPIFVDCGSGLGGVTPAVVGTGWGLTKQAAANAAAANALTKILIGSGVTCKWCDIPGNCHPQVGLLPGGWAPPVIVPALGGGFNATVTYAGAYFVACTEC